MRVCHSALASLGIDVAGRAFRVAGLSDVGRVEWYGGFGSGSVHGRVLLEILSVVPRWREFLVGWRHGGEMFAWRAIARIGLAGEDCWIALKSVCLSQNVSDHV